MALSALPMLVEFVIGCCISLANVEVQCNYSMIKYVNRTNEK